MLALKSIQEKRWIDKNFKRCYASINEKLGMVKQIVLLKNGVKRYVTVVQQQQDI
ncbi:low affinity copper transporter [Colletotrichum higginsianum]|uniref:Low affinity copper transporter n=1 Tax=Colletotrichum higginsianum (strain IMI 349063) TaxID=759273 RepID=H1W246_COLHI|nr:low affinity copper transporter [Colletotrichum higginsianum]